MTMAWPSSFARRGPRHCRSSKLSPFPLAAELNPQLSIERTNDYGYVLDTILDRRTGARLDRIHPHAGFCGAGFGGSVFDRPEQRQYHLVGHQLTIEHRLGIVASAPIASPPSGRYKK